MSLTQQIIDATQQALLDHAKSGFLRSITVGDETHSWASPDEARRFLTDMKAQLAEEQGSASGDAGVQISYAEFE